MGEQFGMVDQEEDWESDELDVLLAKVRVIAERRVKDRIQSPDDVAALLLYDMGKLEQEELWVVLLNTRNEIIEVVHVYRGSVNTSLIRIGELFKEAVRQNAAAIIVAHNHPSGDPTPSPDDVAVTRSIVQAGKLLDVELLDHLVIGKGRFVSLKAKGFGFE